MTRGAVQPSSHEASSGPMPRLGGLTTTTSGAPEADWARAHAVASSATKRAWSRVSPSALARLIAEAMAASDTSTPVTAGTPAWEACRAKPPTPQYRSHREEGAAPPGRGSAAHCAAWR